MSNKDFMRANTKGKIILLFALFNCFSCKEKTKEKIAENEGVKKCYHIETTTYWTKNGNRVSPLSIVKVDTINYIGSSLYYNYDGKLLEQIIILNKFKAIKLKYNNDTIESSIVCRYSVRRDHPKEEIYSIIVAQ